MRFSGGNLTVFLLCGMNLAKLCPATEDILRAGDKAAPAKAKAVCKYNSTNRVGTYHYIIVRISKLCFY